MKIVRPVNDKTPNVSQSYSSKHLGTDYAYPAGTPVYAAAAGKVLYAVDQYVSSWKATPPLKTRDYGNFIKIEHGDGYSTLYAHLKKGSMKVKPGDYVSRGQQIAEINNTGNSTGNHLHWEFRLNERIINPWDSMEREFSWYF